MTGLEFDIIMQRKWKGKERLQGYFQSSVVVKVEALRFVPDNNSKKQTEDIGIRFTEKVQRVRVEKEMQAVAPSLAFFDQEVLPLNFMSQDFLRFIHANNQWWMNSLQKENVAKDSVEGFSWIRDFRTSENIERKNRISCPSISSYSFQDHATAVLAHESY
jgi:hypothetical protein